MATTLHGIQRGRGKIGKTGGMSSKKAGRLFLSGIALYRDFSYP